MRYVSSDGYRLQNECSIIYVSLTHKHRERTTKSTSRARKVATDGAARRPPDLGTRAHTVPKDILCGVRHHAPCLTCDARWTTSDFASCCSTRWPRGTTYSLFQRMARAEASASRGERGRWLSNASAFSAAESRGAPEKMRQKRSVSSAAAVTTVVPSGD